MLALPGMTLLLLATHTAYINTAIHDLEATILSYVSEFLNPEECHELCLALTIKPKDAAEKDLFSPSQWQEISNAEQCKESLHRWLRMQRDAVDWDCLARALRQIGRPDISRELKKSLRENRSLEAKWSPEENQTTEGPRSALLIEEKVPFRRTRHRLIQKHQRTLLKEEGSWPIASFLTWLPLSLHNLPGYIDPTVLLLIATFLTAVSLWATLFCYVMIWKLRQCFFSNGALPPRRISLTLTWNQNMDGNDTQDPDASEEEEWENTEDEDSLSEQYSET